MKQNIAGTKQYVRLAHDLGSPGVNVRPNGVPRGADLDTTLRQIGRALHEVGDDAQGFGVEIRVEVHGGTTQLLPNLARIIQYADHPNVFVCWNSNPTDVVDGSIRQGFDLVASKIREVHLRDLTDEQYPWRDLFGLLGGLRATRATRSPRSPRAPTPSACSATSGPSGWRTSLDRSSGLTLVDRRVACYAVHDYRGVRIACPLMKGSYDRSTGFRDPSWTHPPIFAGGNELRQSGVRHGRKSVEWT